MDERLDVLNGRDRRAAVDADLGVDLVGPADRLAREVDLEGAHAAGKERQLALAVGAQKLSKRLHPETRLDLYRELGYLPEALLNYLALLGWNPGTEQEIFGFDELVGAFDIRRVQRVAHAQHRLDPRVLGPVHPGRDADRRSLVPSTNGDVRPGDQGEGRVIAVNALKQSVVVALRNGPAVEVAGSEAQVQGGAGGGRRR